MDRMKRMNTRLSYDSLGEIFSFLFVDDWLLVEKCCCEWRTAFTRNNYGIWRRFFFSNAVPNLYEEGSLIERTIIGDLYCRWNREMKEKGYLCYNEFDLFNMLRVGHTPLYFQSELPNIGTIQRKAKRNPILWKRICLHYSRSNLQFKKMWTMTERNVRLKPFFEHAFLNKKIKMKGVFLRNCSAIERKQRTEKNIIQIGCFKFVVRSCNNFLNPLETMAHRTVVECIFLITKIPDNLAIFNLGDLDSRFFHQIRKYEPKYVDSTISSSLVTREDSPPEMTKRMEQYSSLTRYRSMLTKGLEKELMRIEKSLWRSFFRRDLQGEIICWECSVTLVEKRIQMINVKSFGDEIGHIWKKLDFSQLSKDGKYLMENVLEKHDNIVFVGQLGGRGEFDMDSENPDYLSAQPEIKTLSILSMQMQGALDIEPGKVFSPQYIFHRLMTDTRVISREMWVFCFVWMSFMYFVLGIGFFGQFPCLFSFISNLLVAIILYFLGCRKRMTICLLLTFSVVEILLSSAISSVVQLSPWKLIVFHILEHHEKILSNIRRSRERIGLVNRSMSRTKILEVLESHKVTNYRQHMDSIIQEVCKTK